MLYLVQNSLKILAVLDSPSQGTSSSNYKIAFAGLTVMFFMWGFITVMNDVLINTFKDLFALSAIELSYIQLSFFGTFFIVSLGYFLISSRTGSDPINRLGYKNGMSISLFISGLGCAIAYHASLLESYSEFLVSLFVLAIGVTLLQICANPYATILGPKSSASSRLNLAQGFNSLGTTIGPIVGTILIYTIFSDGEKTIVSVGKTYLCYGIVFTIMAILVLLSKLPSFVNKARIEKGFGVLKNKNLRLGILAIFFYVGSEVAVGSWIGSFVKEEHIMGLSDQAANSFLAFFWGGLMIGRLMASISLNDKYTSIKKHLYMLIVSATVFLLIWLLTAIPEAIKEGNGLNSINLLDFKSLWIYLIFMAVNYLAFIIGKGNAARMIVIFCSVNAILLLLGIFSTGELAFWSILGTGLFFSIGWSNIFSLSIKGLGELTSQGSSLLVMAIVGGAVLPGIQSYIIDSSNVQSSFIVPLAGMVYLIFFGLHAGQWNPSKNERN
jgi:MFS transporter, FHS family, L-fucose permease